MIGKIANMALSLFILFLAEDKTNCFSQLYIFFLKNHFLADFRPMRICNLVSDPTHFPSMDSPTRITPLLFGIIG